MKNRTARLTTIRLVAPFTLTALAVLLSGCGGEDPDDGEIIEPDPDSARAATMQAFLTDDPDGSAGPAAAPSDYSGTMTGEGDVEVSTDRSTWYMMGSPREFELTLGSGDEMVELTGSTEVPAGTYRHVRINWNGVKANLSAGSRVGDQTLSSNVSLRLGDATTAVMSQEVEAFELEAGGSARIVVDLNSETWVTTRNLSARQIPKDEFESKADVSIVEDD